ncbi:AAA family ATPase [Kineococcus sp. SYSU DK006]|uniref:AAA family ATPase n=1 Tax=Kineococcus sp. SYSU DK006 TaxID=3383127 RepID=UPI003D7D2581
MTRPPRTHAAGAPGACPAAPPAPLLGRARELAALAAAVEAARRGRGGALVVRGPAGIGKSALVARATGTSRVLSVTGTEFEAGLPFAALHQLCAPLLGHLPALPEPQADALRRAFGLAAAPAPSRPDLLIAAGVLTLLRTAGEHDPLVCVVDDAQWVDPASTAALAFAARRLGGCGVALLVALRDGGPDGEPEGGPDGAAPGTAAPGPAGTDPWRGLPQLRLGPLGDEEARALLTAQPHAPLDAHVRDRLVAEARGNPLALLELSRGVPALPALPADAPQPGHAPDLSTALRTRFLQRLAALPAPTRLLVLLAAAEPTGDPLLLWRAAGLVGLEPQAALAAEEAALLVVGTRVRFRHPLVRSAVYEDAPAAQRRAVHRALAAATDPAGDPDRRAWHLALAAGGPDEVVAAELQRCAGRARDRGGLAAAAAFLQRAAALTPDPSLRTDRLLAAAEATRTAGAAEAAVRLLDGTRGEVLTAHQAALAQVVRARTERDRDRGADAARALLQAGRALAGTDVAAAREVLFEAFAAFVFAGRFADPHLAQDLVASVELLPEPDRPDAGQLLFRGLLTQATRGRPAALPLVREAVAACLEPGTRLHGGQLWLACSSAQELWDERALRTIAERQLRLARRTGALADLPVTLSYRALEHVHAGRLDDADELVAESRRVAEELGVPPMLYMDVTVAAWRGDARRTAALVEEGGRTARRRQEGRLLSALEHARTVLLNGQGRHAEALTAGLRAAQLDEHSYRAWIWPDVVEAAVRSGRHELAAELAGRLAEGAAGAVAAGSPWAAGVVARTRALVSPGADAEQHHHEAIEHLQRSAAAPQLARTHLLLGEWLLEAGRRQEGRQRLRTALEQLSALGLEGFAARARRGLAALGDRPAHRADGSGAALSAAERRVAHLVAEGATSKEVAAQLQLSPRTVDAHLRGIFAKLGLTSRRQLREPQVRRRLGRVPGDREQPPGTSA